jgi:ankyrin repeat protein
MTFASRATVLVLAPLLFFGAGALTAVVATETVKRVAVEPTTLLDAAARGDDDAIFRIVAAGEDPGVQVTLQRQVFQWQSGDTTSPLLVAIAEGDFDNVTYMVKHTGHLADPPNDQALCVAARFGQSEIARFLIQRGVPAVPKDDCAGKRPEDLAAERGSASLADALRRYRMESQQHDN